MKKHEDTRQKAVRISNRQYGQLRFLRARPNSTAGLGEIGAFNQTTLGALKRRKFVAETPNRSGVRLTVSGREALEAFDHAEFLRKIASLRFSSFLDLRGDERKAG